MWTELNSKNIKLNDLQAYVTLRGSNLSAEDKKRVLIDADVADGGQLTACGCRHPNAWRRNLPRDDIRPSCEPPQDV